MTTVLLSAIKSASIRPAERIVLALAAIRNPWNDPSRWDQHRSTVGAVPVKRLRNATSFDRDTFEDALRSAVAAGMVWIDHGPRGRRVNLQRSAISLLGLSRRPYRRQIDPDILADLPHCGLLTMLASFGMSMVPVTTLAATTSDDVVDLWEDCLDAERLGLVETWADHPVEPTVTISPIVANRLRLSLSEDGTRWLLPQQFDPTRVLESVRLAGTVIGNESDRSRHDDKQGSGIISDLADPATSEPLEILATEERAGWLIDRMVKNAEEEAEIDRLLARISRHPVVPTVRSEAGRELAEEVIRHLPRPQVFVGMACSWPVQMIVVADPVRWESSGGPCPECSGRTFDRLTYCVVCDRSGVDDLLPPVEVEPPSGISGEISARLLRASRVRQPRSKPRAKTRPQLKSSPATLKGGLER